MSSNPSSLRRGMALTTIMSAQLMLTIDFLIVLRALPKIRTELEFTSAGLSRVPNAFALAFGGLLLLGGRGDIFRPPLTSEPAEPSGPQNLKELS